MTALSGHALGTPALPRFGAWRKDLGAATVAYVSDLTAWERIRELASQRDVRDGSATRWALRKLYVRAMAGFFRAWDQSGGRIVPGAVTPSHLYRLDRFPDGVRFHLYRHTYFAPAGEEVGAAFERLIARQSSDPRALNSQLEELSSLQSLLTDPVDRAVFSRMVFPHARRAQKLELMALGGDERARVIVRSEIDDDSGSRYVVREPLTAVELGNLYRLILETDYPMHIGDRDRQLVIADGEERIVGGLCYRWQEGGVALVDGIVVAPALTNQGLGGRLLEDFCVRMAAEGARLVRTNFFLGGLFTKHGFQVNQRWGGLVRLLGEDADAR